MFGAKYNLWFWCVKNPIKNEYYYDIWTGKTNRRSPKNNALLRADLCFDFVFCVSCKDSNIYLATENYDDPPVMTECSSWSASCILLLTMSIVSGFNMRPVIVHDAFLILRACSLPVGTMKNTEVCHVSQFYGVRVVSRCFFPYRVSTHYNRNNNLPYSDC